MAKALTSSLVKLKSRPCRGSRICEDADVLSRWKCSMTHNPPSPPSIQLGLCGWNGSQPSYFRDFSSIEIQTTFYDPPAARVAARWRSIAPPSFHFCIKAWQLITHEANSPTYRRLRTPLVESERPLVGGFKPTTLVWDAWQRTLNWFDSHLR